MVVRMLTQIKTTLKILSTLGLFFLASAVLAQSEEPSEPTPGEDTKPGIGLLALSSTALPGEDMVVEWNGPEREGDEIHVYKIAGKQPLSKVAAAANNFKPAIIKAPQQAGEYQVRLISNNQTLASAVFSVVSGRAMLKVLSPIVIAGESVSIEWDGPRNSGDSLVVGQVGAKGSISKSPASGTVDKQLDLIAPRLPGKYEVRLQSKSEVVLASQSFEVR